MGLLDDAIREHLDLKRRHGGDPTEVARLEDEALGPVRREPEPAADAGEHPHDEDAHTAAGRDEPAVPHDVAEPHAPEHDDAPDPRHSDIVHQPTTEFHVEDHHDDEDEPPPHRAAEAQTSWADELDDDGPAGRHDDPPLQDEDVLEETPEFLQETPEHDRLWFEQRPPRDFDFDG